MPDKVKKLSNVIIPDAAKVPLTHKQTRPPGLSRSNPYPFGSVATAPDWEFEALQVVRGEDAWERIDEASIWNDPPRDGREYILAEIAVTYTGDSPVEISGSNFAVTGSTGVLWKSGISWRGGFVQLGYVTPAPELDTILFHGGETRGWIMFEVSKDEPNLMLVFGGRNELHYKPSQSRVDSFIDRAYYLALEPNASVTRLVDGLSAPMNLGSDAIFRACWRESDYGFS